MPEMTQVEGPSHARRGLLSRILGIVFSPGETFAEVSQNPRALGVLLFVSLVGAITIGGFLFTQVGQQAWLDQQVSQAESWGRTVSDEQYAQFQRIAPYTGYITVATMLIAVPLLTLITAGILFAIFNAGLGGRATFKQVFAVCAHAGVISALGWIFVIPLNYFRETMTSPTNLSALAPMLEENSFLARLLGTVDLFLIWWVVVLGIGLAVLYRRKTESVVIGLLVAYAVIGVGIAVVRSMFGGS
jgi:hypothetical protein